MTRRAAGVDGGAEHVHGADHVDVGVVERVAHGLADIDLCRSVKDDIGIRVRERTLQASGDVMSSSTNVAAGLTCSRLPAREIIDDGHRVAGVEQRVGDVRADESGAAGDECSHPCTATRCVLGACTWVTTKMMKPITTRLP